MSTPSYNVVDVSQYPHLWQYHTKVSTLLYEGEHIVQKGEMSTKLHEVVRIAYTILYSRIHLKI